MFWKLLNKLAELLGYKENLVIDTLISNSDLYFAVQRDLKPDNVFLSDAEYLTIPTFELKSLLAGDDTNYNTYIANDFDCDDFSYILMGEMTKKIPSKAFGIIWVWWYDTSNPFFKLVNQFNRLVLGRTLVHGDNISGHALNCYYDCSKGKMMLVEPQSDEIFEKPPHWNTTLVLI